MTRRTLGDLLAKVPAPEEPPHVGNITPFERPNFPRIVSRAVVLGAERAKSEPVINASEDRERLVEEAYERGKRDGIAAVQTEYDVKLVEQKAQHVMKVAVDRHRSTAENARIMADRLVDAIKDLESEVCASVAAVLAPFVVERVRHRAIEDLARTLTSMVADRRPANLKVDGPRDLLDALKAALHDFPVPIEYVAVPALAYDPLEAGNKDSVDSIEVQIHLDERVVRTEIGAWLERLRGAMQ
jgi:hypothetical protein